MNYSKQRHTYIPKTELHSHTTCSDGILTPEELVQKAAGKNIRFLSITDHDSTEAFRTVLPMAQQFGMELIPGVEISCCEEGHDIHLLGYAFNNDNEVLQNMLTTIRNQRVWRAEQILHKLRNLDMDISMDAVLHHSNGGSVGRPHIAAAMVDTGSVATLAEAFERFIRDGGPAFHPKEEYAVSEAISVLHNAGGIAVIAHPGRWVRTRDVVRYIDEGLDGIEVYHPSHTRSSMNYLRNLALRYEIIGTGGSDYHGTRDYDEDNFGNFPVDETVADRLLLISKNALSFRQVIE